MADDPMLDDTLDANPVRQSTRDTGLIRSFAKGLAVIECFDRESSRLSIAEVAARTGLERATARRFLLTLAKLGYADFDGKFFSLTPRVLRLGYAYLSSTPLPSIVQRVLEPLSMAVGESLSASTLDGKDIVYIARASNRRVMSINLAVGSRLPAYCTSMGRVLLAALPEEVALQRMCSSNREKLTPQTKTDLDALMAELSAIRNQDFAVVDGELELGLRSIAVPVYNATGTVVAAINCGTHASRLSAEELTNDILPHLLRAQSDLRTMLMT
jgi:IclR family pca regulon transcriptional regulator